MIPDLATLDEAAKELGIPKASLRSAAESHGFLVRMGREIRIDRNDFKPLVKKYQNQAKAPASINSSIARSGTSATPASPTGQRAAQAASKLKKRSQPTSPPKDGKVLQMSRPT
ncbi:hypothetical protein [Pseudophaeobacter sp. EL27]|uniref:hypothetical protein n=1 Tax=Pseudophaeobacter sp. EL27 TaxID=2107580 RepID=UPI000EFCCE26|nr:hypothetical protein [Pseudophaeobacter sp. EL27]